MRTNQIPQFTIGFKSRVKASQSFTITSSKDVAEVARKCFEEDTIDWVESFIVIALSKANKVLGSEIFSTKLLGFFKVSQGGITGTVADPRVILQFALLSNATSIIIAHNHPSGNLKPSRQDEDLTEKIKMACSYFDIKVLDHLIVTSESYLSFSDEGLL